MNTKINGTKFIQNYRRNEILCGYRVQVKTANVVTHDALFQFSKYGSKREALSAAVAYRDKILIPDLPVRIAEPLPEICCDPPTCRTQNHRCGSGVSGVCGVHAQSKDGELVGFTVRRVVGGKTKFFGVNHYGSRHRALVAAIEHHHAGLPPLPPQLEVATPVVVAAPSQLDAQALLNFLPNWLRRLVD